MNIAERLEALATHLEVMSGLVKDLVKRSEKGGENIRALARIAALPTD